MTTTCEAIIVTESEDILSARWTIALPDGSLEEVVGAAAALKRITARALEQGQAGPVITTVTWRPTTSLGRACVRALTTP